MSEHSRRDRQEQWLTALESGDYTQCQEKLKANDSFCCLGVAVELFAKGEWHTSAGTTEWFPEDARVDGQYFESYMPDTDWQELGLFSNNGEFVFVDDEMDSGTYIIMYGDGSGVQSIKTLDEANQADLVDRGYVLSRAENLAELNDQGASFQQIATFMRNNASIVFDLELNDEFVTAVIDGQEGAT